MPVIVLALLGCEGPLDPSDQAVFDQLLRGVGPQVLVPGTRLVVEGEGWLPDLAGPTALRLSGSLGGRPWERELPTTFVDERRLEVSWPGDVAPGTFEGTASVRTHLAFDGLVHASNELPLKLVAERELVPVLDALDDPGAHVNDAMVVTGEGFLLGGDEGDTVARVEGCFTPSGGGSCRPVGPVEVPARPAAELDRSAVVVPFAPEIAGIEPGTFEGTLTLVNRHPGGEVGGVGAAALDRRIRAPEVERVTPGVARLGQWVDVAGAGFVGPSEADPSAVTLLELDGTFDPDQGTAERIVVTLVPEFREGALVRYVVNEEDALGRSLDVRYGPGVFRGAMTPVVAFGASEVAGAPTEVELTLQPVRQVVWLHVLPSTWESLRHFGLREARGAVVDRVFEVVARDYAGVNVELRRSEPTDYALYAVVEVGGPDPNDLGLLGYDNTPGKDVGNQRLYDRVGGLNAVTQLDGYPGYGGVFVESLFAFSRHPGPFATVGGEADAAFDELFDPFRPDLGGAPVTAEEVAGAPVPASNADCPAQGRSRQVGCAVFAMGNLIGTTLSHELAHSMGLADPDGDQFHNTGDWVGALMDGGSYRTFRERAEVYGEGPGTFCSVNYDYLRRILPTDEPDPLPERQECY